MKRTLFFLLFFIVFVPSLFAQSVCVRSSKWMGVDNGTVNGGSSELNIFYVSDALVTYVHTDGTLQSWKVLTQSNGYDQQRKESYTDYFLLPNKGESPQIYKMTFSRTGIFMYYFNSSFYLYFFDLQITK